MPGASRVETAGYNYFSLLSVAPAPSLSLLSNIDNVEDSKQESKDLQHQVNGFLFQVVNQSFASYTNFTHTKLGKEYCLNIKLSPSQKVF